MAVRKPGSMTNSLRRQAAIAYVICFVWFFAAAACALAGQTAISNVAYMVCAGWFGAGSILNLLAEPKK